MENDNPSAAQFVECLNCHERHSLGTNWCSECGADLSDNAPAIDFGKAWAKGIIIRKIRELDDEKLRLFLAHAVRDGWVANNEARARGEQV